MAINLREEFDELMEDAGHWMLLRQRQSGRHCHCWNEQTEDAYSACEKCLGTGHAYIDQFVLGRKLTRFEMPEKPGTAGMESSPLIRMYIRHSAPPDRNDFICEIALQPAGSDTAGSTIPPIIPVQITRVYDVQDVDDMRARYGRIEYWRLLVEEADLGDLS